MRYLSISFDLIQFEIIDLNQIIDPKMKIKRIQQIDIKEEKETSLFISLK